MSDRSRVILAAQQHLASVEPFFARLIEEVPNCSLAHSRDHVDLWEELVGTVIGQQLSGKAATAIENKFKALAPPYPTPNWVRDRSIEELRSAGLSNAKAKTILGIAHEIDQLPTCEELLSWSEEAIAERLVKLKGVGPWTVDMLLIFRLGRLDVLPVGDLGVRKGFQNLLEYQGQPTESLPQAAEMIAIAEPWRPYRSVASWYLWRSLEQVVSTGETKNPA